MSLNGIVYEVGPTGYATQYFVNSANEYSSNKSTNLFKGYLAYDKYDIKWKQIKIGPLCLVEWSD